MSSPSTFFSSRFADALGYAHELHALQLRKGGRIPYISHLLAVTSIVLDAGGTEDEAIAALLHDGPEDQGGLETLAEIRRRFGEGVADIVEGCSDTFKTPKPPWEERKRQYVAHLADADSSTLLVSAADKLHNARATLQDLNGEAGPRVWDRFSATKEQTLANYHNLIEAYLRGRKDDRRQPIVADLQNVVAAMLER